MELRYFTAVAEHLNYSEASRRIHVAQPAISQTILDLEEELGVRLLLRDRRTVRLTAAGETYRREALEILHLVRPGGLVLFCRLQPASAPVELRLSWRRGAPSSPTVEAFRELVQSRREAIREVMEARPSEKKERQRRRP